ncbi:serine protease 23-like [Parambassis ranga]|uniref:Inactive serine protease 35 n=1 Tax=Parambassis ranga TaxID=210632 RepID=A0A6P7HXK3_9TELE|nr:serine protease 23-like [Parambassis ranga]
MFAGMDLRYVMCVLFCAAALTVSAVLGQNERSDVYRWTRQSLPELLVRHTAPVNTPLFIGKEEKEDKGTTICGIECQSSLPPMDQVKQERILGYETMYENGTRTHTDVSLLGFNMTSGAHTSFHTRRKRQVYGVDGRFVISDSHFITNYPFSAAVRLSTGCSGVLISPKHVLTAARCIHDGKDYLESSRKLKVGVLQLKIKRGRFGRRRGGRRRSGGEEKAEEQLMEGGEEKNSIDGERGRRGGAGRRHRGGRGGKEGVTDRFEGRRRKLRTLSRIRRSTETGKQPVFRWTRVKQTRIPQGWILSMSSNNSVSSDYNYALLELRRPVKQRYMELGVAPAAAPLTRIHFSGFDADKSLLDGHGDEKVIYRFCSVAKESNDLMYQHCDAQPGAMGAGVYIRLRQEEEQKGKWQRRVIGVFAGHQWVDVEGGDEKDFNVAVRITPLKYAQICQWIRGDPSLCKEI